MTRVLLFGSPGAGKTSLLGALAQAAATQAPPLKGTLVDPSGAWDRLRQSTYSPIVASTDNLATHDFKLQPTDNGSAATEARILDCSGKSARELLNAKSPFAEPHQLNKPILAADAILLLVDASLPGKQMVDEFRQLGNWLTELKQTRGQRADIGDLPVYLVLTKCDALGAKDDTATQWKQKLDEAKKKVDVQFRKFLTNEGEDFGSLDLKLWATAIKRPPLANSPASPQQPYGVAELFRECVQSAGEFARRRQTSQLRLYNLVVGLIGAIILLGLSLAFLFEWQPDTKSFALDEQVHAVLPRADAKAPQRLGGTLKNLQERQKRLADIEASPEFKHLPAESRAAAHEYRLELEQYLKLSDDIKTKMKFPLLATTEEEFVKQEAKLAAIACPPEWNDTQLGKRIKQCRTEYAAVDKAVKDRMEWLAEQTKQNNALLDQGADLQLKVRRKTKLGPQEVELWDVRYRAQMLAHPVAMQSDPIPGVTGVTYEFLERFQAIKDARKRADSIKTQLRRVAENIQDELKGT